MTAAVVIALYNGERFLLEQLDSIRNQTKEPDEVIFCDDGSKDNTVEMVKEYIARYGLENKWKLIINEANLGYARNFYKLMSLSSCDLIFLCDQDDVWKADKIEKMSAVMENNPHINVLSCRFGIIDGQGNEMRGLLVKQSKDTMSLREINEVDLLRAYYWLGMLMCVRRSFYTQIMEAASKTNIAHDRVLAHCAADTGSFYELDYTGAYHRRHDNNTEREEHRIAKLLDLPKKLREIDVIVKLWGNMIASDLPISDTHKAVIQERVDLMKKREAALKEKSMKLLCSTYRNDKKHMLRLSSLLCDIWLVCFGKN